MARPRPSAFDRLMAKCVETNPPEGSQISRPCLTFTGYKNPNGGHGQIKHNGKLAYAHRVAFEHKHGPIPKGMVLMHLCDNPACCNTDHLTIGTKKDNNHDAVLKGRHMGKNALPNLIKRICLLRQSGKTPEDIAKETGYAPVSIRSILEFLDDDDCIYTPTLAAYGDDLADSQRLERFVHDQHTLAAITVCNRHSPQKSPQIPAEWPEDRSGYDYTRKDADCTQGGSKRLLEGVLSFSCAGEAA